MHVALEDTEEIVNGKVVNRYGDSFLRGNNSEFLAYTAEEIRQLIIAFSPVYYESAMKPA